MGTLLELKWEERRRILERGPLYYSLFSAESISCYIKKTE